MKEIFDWLRERIKEESATGFVTRGASFRYLPTVTAENIITEAEAKLKEKEAELRDKAIDEFSKRMKDANKTNAFVLYQSDEIDLEEFIGLAVDEIASQMKGEKE